MFAVLPTLRKVIAPLARPRGVVAALPVFALAACDPGTMPGPIGGTGAPAPDGEVQVALLVPDGSGDRSDEVLARSLENAARMAMADLSGVDVDLRVYETAGQSGRAADAARRAVDEGADVILGPTFSSSASRVREAVGDSGVTMLSFSNNAEIAGGNLFVLGPTFSNTAQRLAEYAAGEGRGRIMIVHERNDSGEQGRRAIERAASASGASIAAVESFSFSQQGVVDALPRIADTARGGGVDSIFFTADTAGALPLLAELLPENRVSGEDFQFIGLTRWDIPRSTLELSGVQGGWFALPDPAMTQRFKARYRSRYGEDPHTIAGLAYDGMAAIGALVERGERLSADAFTVGSGFSGVNGPFRLLRDGTNERALAVAEIRDEEVSIIDPAPRRFTGPGL